VTDDLHGPVEDAAGEADRPGRRGLLSRVAVDITPLRASKPFRRLWFGTGISAIGSQITTVAIPFQVYDLTGSTAIVGLLALVEAVPLVVSPIVGGALADAVERRRFLIVAQALTAALSAALAVNAFLPEPHLLGVLRLRVPVGERLLVILPGVPSVPARLLTTDLDTSATVLEVVLLPDRGVDRAGPDRRDDRHGRRRVGVRGRRDQLPGRGRCAGPHVAVAADGRTSADRPGVEPRRAPAPPDEPGPPGRRS
jgi:transmembrane secretion effector